jgi:hypothetical protein
LSATDPQDLGFAYRVHNDKHGNERVAANHPRNKR